MVQDPDLVSAVKHTLLYTAMFVPASIIGGMFLAVALHRQGKFPVEALMTFYDFDQIEQAAQDAGAGRTIKPVLRMS